MTRDSAISLDLQMIKNPYTSAKKWDTMVEQSPETYAFKMQPLSHPDTRITTKASELILKYSCQVKLSHYVSLVRQEVKGNSLYSTELQDFWYIIYEKNGIVTIHIRFPNEGVYILKLLAKVATGDEQLKAKTMRSLMYRITYNGKSGVSFPQGLGHNWGEQPDYLAAGFSIVEPASTVIITKDGFVKVKQSLPSTGYVANLHHLVKSEVIGNSIKKTNLDQYVYGEKSKDEITYYIQCPVAGEYRFEIYAKYDNSSNGGYYVGVAENACLIQMGLI